MPHPTPLARILCTVSLVLAPFLLSGCGDAGPDVAGLPDTANASGQPDTGLSNPASPPAVLLFAGTGTSPNDVAAFEKILSSNRIGYAKADSRQLNEPSVSLLAAHRLLIVPGGNFEDIGKGLTAATAANIRKAVRSGMSYLGICAGAFFAGDSPYNGLNLTEGVRFKFYALEYRDIRKAPVAIAIAGSGTFDHYWEDGPQLTGWGSAVAKYPDGSPAIVEGTAGKGWVVLSGVHPEAPETWRRGMSFATPAPISHAYAATLVDAALNRIKLAHY